MKLITDSKELSKTFKRLCTQYAHYKWAVAWAGDPNGFDLAKLLEENETKIDRIVVGLHFYQTSPNFIEKYMNNKHVQFIKQSDGTFHSKMYLFYNDETEWEAIIGSANFTLYGFHKNDEANIVFCDKDAGVSFSELDEYISSVWENSEKFSKNDLDSYKTACSFQKKKTESLKKITPKIGILDMMTWDEYIKRIRTEDKGMYTDRIEMLDKAQEIFANCKNFDSLDPDTKRAFGGYIEKASTMPDCDFNWKMFGSMTGVGKFKQAINNNVKIGKALDKIPLDGEVTRKQFDAYCKAFDEWENPIACATRLLALKRPDLFVCINKKNKKKLSELLNIPQSHFILANYWDEILQRIYNSVWFNDESELASKDEKVMKNYKVAMLDSISCEW